MSSDMRSVPSLKIDRVMVYRAVIEKLPVELLYARAEPHKTKHWS